MMKKLLDVLVAIIVLPGYLAILLIRMIFMVIRFLLGLVVLTFWLTFWVMILFPPPESHDIAYQSHAIDQKCRVSTPATAKPTSEKAVKSCPEDAQLKGCLCPVLPKAHRPQDALVLSQGHDDLHTGCSDAEPATSYPHCRVNFPTGIDEFTVRRCTTSVRADVECD